MIKFILPFFLLLALASCQERNELIDLTPPVTEDQIKIDSFSKVSSTGVPQPKAVLLEDFTGVKCVNCPAAQQEAKAIAEAFPEQTVIVAYHVTTFARPYPENKYDFRTDFAENLYNTLGTGSGLPIGTVDRVIYNGNRYIFFNQWGAKADERRSPSSSVTMNFNDVKLLSSRNLITGELQVVLQEDVREPYLSIYITEDGIVDAQITPTGIVTDYVHNHVFRKALPPQSGQLLPSRVRGDVAYISFSALVDEARPGNKLNVVAFVHSNTSDDKEILQVSEVVLE